MTRALDGLVERACRRDELLRAACRESRALSHPERPARGPAMIAMTEVVPPGAGDSQTEFYRRLTEATFRKRTVVKTIRVMRL